MGSALSPAARRHGRGWRSDAKEGRRTNRTALLLLAAASRHTMAPAVLGFGSHVGTAALFGTCGAAVAFGAVTAPPSLPVRLPSPPRDTEAPAPPLCWAVLLPTAPVWGPGGPSAPWRCCPSLGGGRGHRCAALAPWPRSIRSVGSHLYSAPPPFALRERHHLDWGCAGVGLGLMGGWRGAGRALGAASPYGVGWRGCQSLWGGVEGLLVHMGWGGVRGGEGGERR